MPSLPNLSHHELAVLAKAAEQVNSVCEREWITALAQRNWPVAQLVERRAVNADVARSSRARSASLEVA